MKLITFSLFIIVAAACTTIFFVSTLKPTGIGAFLFFAVWLVIPYIIMGALLLLLQRAGKTLFHWCVVAIIISVGGILFLADVIFWHTDAQGALAVLMAPIFQGIALVLLLPATLWLTRNVRIKRGRAL